jgi:paraquat-inducible protein A
LPQSKAATSKAQQIKTMPKFLLPLLLLGASLSFALGVTLPLMQVDRLYFFTTTPSLIDITASLWTNGDIAIAIITALFSLIFPLAKLAALHLAAYPADGAALTLPSWFKAIARWSMLDVLVVALVIFAAKTSGLASAAAKPGLWFFALSVVLTALASASVARDH